MLSFCNVNKLSPFKGLISSQICIRLPHVSYPKLPHLEGGRTACRHKFLLLAETCKATAHYYWTRKDRKLQANIDSLFWEEVVQVQREVLLKCNERPAAPSSEMFPGLPQSRTVSGRWVTNGDVSWAGNRLEGWYELWHFTCKLISVIKQKNESTRSSLLKVYLSINNSACISQ